MYSKLRLKIGVLLIVVLFSLPSTAFGVQGYLWPTGGILPPTLLDMLLDFPGYLINQWMATGGDPVHLKNGEYYLSVKDLVTHGRVLDVAIERSYSSRSAYNSRFGYGWDMNYNIKFRKLQDTGKITVLSGQNRIQALAWKLISGPEQAVYKSPLGLHEYLVENEDGTYTIVKKDGTEQNFYSNGNLKQITDRNGNSLTFIYDSNLSYVYGPLDFSYIVLLQIQGTPRGIVGVSHKLTKITDDLGRDIDLDYNSDGLLSTVTDFTGRTWTYSYDAVTNDLLSVQDPNGLSTSYTYSNHKLLTITDPNGQTYLMNHYTNGAVDWQIYGDGTCTFNYASGGSQATVTDAKGFNTTAIYDSNGLLLSSTVATSNLRQGTDPPSYTTRYEYNPNMELTKMILPVGNFITYTYDANGNVLTIAREPNNGDPNIVTTFTYDPNFNLLKTMTDPYGHVTTCDYDLDGNLIKITYPQVSVPGQSQPVSPVASFTYNEFGQLETATDPNKMVAEYVYYNDSADPNNRGRLWKIIVDANENDPRHLDITTEYKYDKWGNVREITDPNGSIAKFRYNELNLLKQAITPSPYNNVTNFYYNRNKKLSSLERVKSGGNQVTSYTYDQLDKLKTVTNPLNYVTTNSYDVSTNLTQVTDANNHSTNSAYDERNMLWKVTDANDGVTECNYTPNGKLAKIKDALGHETTYEYDGFDRLKKIIYPGGTYEQFTYDKNSNILSKRNRAGQIIYYEYDELNRLSCKTRPGEPNTVYRYDIAGRLYDVTDHRSTDEGGGTTTYHYDRIGRVVQVDSPGPKVVKYEYSNRGLRTKLTYPDNSYITYEYDAMGRLSAIKDSGGNAFAQYSYDELSRREKVTLGNDANAVYEYDPANRLTKLTNHISSSQSIVFRYDNYDHVGNRLNCKIDDANAHTYTYDMLYELTNVNYHDGNSTTYGYDKLGSRTSAAGLAYARNSLNQYTSVGGTSYSYDPNGNLTYDGTYNYYYDCENRLKEVKNQSGSTIATYKYDYRGRRVIKTAGGTTTKYVYDGDQIIAEYEGGSLVRRFVYGPGIDEPICMTAGSSTYYYHFDGLGSVVALSNATGSIHIVERYSYDVYGEPNRTSGINNPYFFTGRQYDAETGLYYYRTRYYKPSIGRFLQTDPIRYRSGLNLYMYCWNNPARWCDPSGRIIVVSGDGTAVGQGYSYLWESPQAIDTFTYLNNSPDTYTIITISNHDDRYNAKTNTVYWDPTSGLKTTNGDVQSPALGLAHEMEHARNDAEGDMDYTPDAQYNDAEERNVITGPEAEIANDLGEATRTDHFGDPLRVDDPTYHKEIKKSK